MKPKTENICNIASYKFITLNEVELPTLCKKLKRVSASNAIKGTILLSTEGINLFLAGEKPSIQAMQEYIATYPEFADLSYKYSYSDFVPFNKLSVKVRKEIVTFKQDQIMPEKFTAPYLTPEQLKNWLDTEKDFLLLDTRNSFEFDMGTFEKAVHLDINNFREFAEAVRKSNLDRDKPIVTACTGGIRCEKAAAYLLEIGFEEVYQLQGGLLNYFERCGGEHYQGNCFVFDDRIAVDPELKKVENIEFVEPVRK